jgi:hypothetical protein
LKEKAPLLVRAFVFQDRLLSLMVRASVMIRDEMLWAWTSPRDRERANRAIFADQVNYFPGGSTFEQGLFDWERTAITSPPFPPSGRILLGGAGAGRELAELCKMGYQVLAFEPSAALAEAAGAVAAPYPESKVIRASYRDLVLAVENGSGPLAPHVGHGEFQGVILGWTSICYVWRPERMALLKALRSIAPHAPVLLSYWLVDDQSEGRLGKVRCWFRRLLRMTGAQTLAEPGDTFVPWGGFLQRFTPEEVQSLADRAGYQPAYVRRQPEPHAIFIPRL